jgi:SAM-dependent methyltransferase
VNWDKAWADAVEANEQISSNKDKWLDFWNQYSEQYSIEVKAERQLHLKVLSYLEREGWLRRGDGVIDIGCGPGTYALLLAEHARWLLALTRRRCMLDKVKEEAIKAGIMNINLWLDRWEDARPKVKYDLAICARSPAIKDRCGLLKMEEMSSRDCCLSQGYQKRKIKTGKHFGNSLLAQLMLVSKAKLIIT